MAKHNRFDINTDFHPPVEEGNVVDTTKNRLNKKQRRRLESVVKRLDRVRLNLGELDEARLMTVVNHVNQTQSDGYKSDTRLIAHVSGSGGSSPTENAALRRGENAEKLLRFIEKTVQILDVGSQEIIHALALPMVDDFEKHRGRQSGDQCMVCNLPARFRGFCEKDYNRWKDYGHPDPHRWTLFLKMARNSEGALLVQECPPPAPGKTARRGPWRFVEDEQEPGPDQYTN